MHFNTRQHSAVGLPAGYGLHGRGVGIQVQVAVGFSSSYRPEVAGT
jgi:hypothetical protein